MLIETGGKLEETDVMEAKRGRSVTKAGVMKKAKGCKEVK